MAAPRIESQRELSNASISTGDTGDDKPRAKRAARILLVEDDTDIATMYRFKPEPDGFSVHLADAGETALMLAFRRPPDLALLAIGLPDMDGLQVLRADARTVPMPVVILSSWDDPELIRRGFELGAIEYLVKTEATRGTALQRAGGRRRRSIRGWRGPA